MPTDPLPNGTPEKLYDYNGVGEWSRQRVCERYSAYCSQLGIEPRTLEAREHLEGNTRWIYPILDDVIAGIAEGDRACIALGVDLIEEDQRIPFGLLLKYQTARGLRRAELTPEQILRLRKRIVFMFLAGMRGRYFTEYVKLLRTIHVAELWPELDAGIQRDDPRTMRHYQTLRQNDPTAPRA